MEACTYRKGKLCHCIHTFWSSGSLQTRHSARTFCRAQNRVEVHCSLYDFCDTDSFFGIPRPLAFYDPHKSTSFLSVGGPSSELRRRPPRSLVNEGDFKLLELDTAAYAMDQVLPIPLLTAKTIRTLFYPPNMPNALDPTLCRLYFGKVIKELGLGGRPNRFFQFRELPPGCFQIPQAFGGCRRSRLRIPFRRRHRVRHGWNAGSPALAWRVWWPWCRICYGRGLFQCVAMHIIDFNQVWR